MDKIGELAKLVLALNKSRPVPFRGPLLFHLTDGQRRITCFADPQSGEFGLAHDTEIEAALPDDMAIIQGNVVTD